MAANTNPFKPRDTKGQVLKAVAAGTLVATVFGLGCLAFSSNGYVSYGTILVSFFATSYAVYRRGKE